MLKINETFKTHFQSITFSICSVSKIYPNALIFFLFMQTVVVYVQCEKTQNSVNRAVSEVNSTTDKNVTASSLTSRKQTEQNLFYLLLIFMRLCNVCNIFKLMHF